MITRFDAHGEVHLGDDSGMVDVNIDAVARGLLKGLIKPKKKRKLLQSQSQHHQQKAK